MYTANEQGNSVSAYNMDTYTGRLAHMQTVPTVPDDFADTSHCSEIKIHPSGRWLLAPNRGHNSIAIYEVNPADGAPALLIVHVFEYEVVFPTFRRIFGCWASHF